MKIATVVGARPQFIKAAVVSHALRKKHTEVLIHTGQHFDYNMSEQFFKELDIPTPDYNLGISGGTHAQMTGNMMIAIEEVLQKEQPDWLLVYGDTNSTLAAALAAAKLHIPICHVEAGARVHSMTNPEEINRICTDHVSSLLLVCTESGIVEAKKEGLDEKAHLVGDPMYDAFVEYSGKIDPGELKLVPLKGTGTTVHTDNQSQRQLSGNVVSTERMKQNSATGQHSQEESTLPAHYYYLTCHREENTRNDSDLNEILRAMNSLDALTVYPVHPRNKERALRLKELHGYDNLILTEPVGYLESTCLVKHAEAVVTDSGGLQREAFFAGKKCVTVLDFVAWPETMVDGRNTLSRPDTEQIVAILKEPQTIDPSYQPFGDGYSARKIVQELECHIKP